MHTSSESSGGSEDENEQERESELRSRSRFLMAKKDTYGYTFGTNKDEKIKNYEVASTFRMMPIAHVPDEKHPSILFLVNFSLSKTEAKVAIKFPDFYDFKKSCAKVRTECKLQLVHGNIAQKDFQKLQEDHIKVWSDKAYAIKQPVLKLGLQRHIMPSKVKDWKAEDLEWFFHKDLGIIGIDGKQKKDPKCVYVAELMAGVPQIACEFSGYKGWKEHLQPPYTSNMGGEIYMESVCMSANIAHLTFHGMMFREWWEKLGMICVAGKPNMAKTKEIMCALHMSSSRQFFYAMKATPEFLQMMCERVGLMIACDDNDSLRKEEILAVSRFEGAAVGTKGSGAKQQIGELVLTSNIEIERKDKIRQGRVHVIRKMYPGFVEEENCLLALDVLADLNEALKSVKQPLNMMARTWCYWFMKVDIPAELRRPGSQETQTSQMRLWFSMVCKHVRDITVCSMRENFTIAALNTFPYMYDALLPQDHEWHKNGGATFYYGTYFPKALASNAQLYAKPLENPGIPLIQRFNQFVRQSQTGATKRLETINDRKVIETPGDFIEEIRIVWTKAKNGEMDLFLAFSKYEDFGRTFQCTDGISVFLDFIKKENSLPDYRFKYQQKSIHATAISMKFFEVDLRKSLIKTLMRRKISVPCKNYSSSVRRNGLRREALPQSEDSDYEDSGEQTEVLEVIQGIL